MATGGGGRLKGIFVCSVSFIEQGEGRLLKQGHLLQCLQYLLCTPTWAAHLSLKVDPYIIANLIQFQKRNTCLPRIKTVRTAVTATLLFYFQLYFMT